MLYKTCRYLYHMYMNCLYCKKQIPPCTHKTCLRRGRKFCSPICHHRYVFLKPKAFRQCLHCKQQFNGGKNHWRQKFCSTKCRYANMIGWNHPRYKAARTLDKSGYIVISRNGKLLKEHRVIMEQHLGRALLPIEVVHHINHNRSDNRIENLMLVESNSAHRKLHSHERWSRKHDACISCYSTARPHHAHGLCSPCLNRKNWIQRKHPRINPIACNAPAENSKSL